MFPCRCRRFKVGGMGFLKLISQAFPRPLPQSPLVFFPLFRSLYFSLALHYLNAWNRLTTIKSTVVVKANATSTLRSIWVKTWQCIFTRLLELATMIKQKTIIQISLLAVSRHKGKIEIYIRKCTVNIRKHCIKHNSFKK